MSVYFISFVRFCLHRGTSFFLLVVLYGCISLCVSFGSFRFVSRRFVSFRFGSFLYFVSSFVISAVRYFFRSLAASVVLS